MEKLKRLTPGQMRYIGVLGERMPNGERRSKTDAYLIAFPNSKKWKRRTLQKRASEMSRKPHVAAALENIENRAIARLVDKAVITKERVMTKLANMAYARMDDVATFEDGILTVKNFSDLSRAQMDAIKTLRVIPTKFGVEIRVELHDQRAAIDMCMKHLGEYTQAEIERLLPVVFEIKSSEESEGAGESGSEGTEG